MVKRASLLGLLAKNTTYFDWFEEVVVVVGGLVLVERRLCKKSLLVSVVSLVAVCQSSLVAPQALASGCVGILCHSSSGLVFRVVSVEEPFRRYLKGGGLFFLWLFSQFGLDVSAVAKD